jgi:cation diffusion facilitator family transporter
MSVVVGVLLLSTKVVAWQVTGSAAVMSDALESIINVVASLFALFAIWFAERPADESHPYGHGKIEFFSAGFEGALIMLAAIGIVVAAVGRLVTPREVEQIGLGMALVGVSGGVNLLMGVHLVRTGRATGSMALEADGQHLLTDWWTSLGVVVGLAVVKWTGWVLLDPLLAMGLAGHILWNGWGIVRASAGRLLDEADAELLESIALTLRKTRREGHLTPHQLRATRHGQNLVVDLHMFMPRNWELALVHDESDAIEHGIQGEFGAEAEAIIHVDPCREDHCVRCDLTACSLRNATQNVTEEWTATQMRSQGEHPDFDRP